MRYFLVAAASLLLFLAGTEPARALTAVSRDFDQLVTRADTVFKGTVTAKNSCWIGEGDTRHIVTLVTFQVEETYKGVAAAEQTLRFLGGTVGEDTMTVPDMPQFEIGQNAVLFVVGNGKQFCPLVGIAQGRYHVLKEAGTGRERIFTDDFTPVTGTDKIGRVDEAGVSLLRRHAVGNAAPQAMAAEDFRSAVVGKVAALAR